MTYSEYRQSFETVEEFEQTFGRLSEEEAYALISTIQGSPAIKACAVSIWRRAREKSEQERQLQKTSSL